MHNLEEVGREADIVRSEIEQLYVRGLAASSAADRAKLKALAEEWERIGAGHVASRLIAALRAAEAGASEAPRALLSAHTSVAVFERVVSLEAAAEAWSAHIEALREAAEEDGGDDGEGLQESAATPAEKPAAAPPMEDPKGALALAEELVHAVEDLVRTGLTSATDSTRAKLDASFKEASRRKLLRLGASLRYVNDDINRFLANDEAFSLTRFSLFLHRSWLLARGVAKGIRDKNDRLIASLLGSGAGGGAPRPVTSLEVVTLGVLKQTNISAHAFDFKLRIVGPADTELLGRSLTYSIVAMRKEMLSADSHLHNQQPQGFMLSVFCQGTTVKLANVAVTFDDRGAGRLLLGPRSTVTRGSAFPDWAPLFRFDPEAALRRARRHSPSPFDLPREMQEEVIVVEPKLHEDLLRKLDTRRVFCLSGAGGLTLDAVIPDNPYGEDGEETLDLLRTALRGARQPLLYGLAYYEFGRMMFFPLSLLDAGADAEEVDGKPAPSALKSRVGPRKERKVTKVRRQGPVLFTLSEKTHDKGALVKSLY